MQLPKRKKERKIERKKEKKCDFVNEREKKRTGIFR